MRPRVDTRVVVPHVHYGPPSTPSARMLELEQIIERQRQEIAALEEKIAHLRGERDPWIDE